jgi:hypothetical protein
MQNFATVVDESDLASAIVNSVSDPVFVNDFESAFNVDTDSINPNAVEGESSAESNVNDEISS